MNKTKLLLLLISLILISSCAVKMVADYDQNTINQVIEISKMIDLFYIRLYEADSSGSDYENFHENYIYIEAEINSLIFLQKVRSYNDYSLKNAENLLTNWLEIKEYHKKNGSYNITVAEEDKEILQSQLLELVKKEQIKK